MPGGEYWTVIISSPISGKKQQWLLDDLATNTVSTFLSQPSDYNGSEHGFYYSWNTGANLTQAEINSITKDYDTGVPLTNFHIPSTDDMWKLQEIVGSMDEAVSILELDFDGGYKMWEGDYKTNYCFMWLSNQNIGYPSAGTFVWIQYKDASATATLCFPNALDFKLNVRLVRDL
jgi:uncharacterized protein (TIGR02145 family)